jgi:two-component system C4-dicarboxylate transport response regulator DctD
MGCVLIIEDDADSREAVTEALADAGFETRVAPDGLAAIGELQNNDPPALVLLDTRMPRMGGREFLDWLQAHPEHANIPVIITSADVHADGHPRALAMLRKPYDLDALLAIVRRFCTSAS